MNVVPKHHNNAVWNYDLSKHITIRPLQRTKNPLRCLQKQSTLKPVD